MDGNVLGGFIEGILGGALGIVGGIVITVFGFKASRKGLEKVVPSNGKTKAYKCPNGANGHCVDHKQLTLDVRETKSIAIENREMNLITKNNVEWLVNMYKSGRGV